MFKIENGILKFGEFKITLPQDVRDKTPSKIFGTSTSGLDTRRGIFLESDGLSGRVGLADGKTISGHVIGDILPILPMAGHLVHIREQIDVCDNNKIFWLISLKEIEPELNWVTVIFTDGSSIKICPFTKYYKICQNKQ